MPLDIDEIAGLALLPDVESRLIQTRETNGKTDYLVSQDPVTEERLANLGPRDWTLLVHDVDKHLPDLRQIFDHFEMVPDWLLDDLMISIAAPGGSVGPHTDSYDVFLLQGDGERRWSTGMIGTPVSDHPLRLVTKPAFDQQFDCSMGDLLYVPPGHIHHGVAETLCSTWSIGFQAPLLRDIAAMTNAVLPETLQDARYDPILPTHAPSPGLIPMDAVAHIPINAKPEALVTALGQLVTTCKTSLRPDSPSAADFDAIADPLHVHGYSRLAYALMRETLLVFANGQVATFNRPMQSVIADLCTRRLSSPHPDHQDLYQWLFGVGVFDFTD